jgi:hypothetical protein
LKKEKAWSQEQLAIENGRIFKIDSLCEEEQVESYLDLRFAKFRLEIASV